MDKKKATFRDFLDKKGISKRGMILWAAALAVLLVVCILLQGLSGTDNGRTFPVYINEVLASNTSRPNADGRCCDYIEIYNSADYPVDLTGFQLGDIAGSARYAFPYGTVIEAGGYLVIYCDSTVEDPAYAPFGISRSGGETFYLIASNSAIVDSVTTIAMDVDQAMVLQAAGEWGLSATLTPGQDNSTPADAIQDIYNGKVSPVRITELSVANTGYVSTYGVFCDWVELHNTGSEAIDLSGYSLSDNVGNEKYIFPDGTQIAAGAYLVVSCTTEATGPDIAPFGLSQLGGETVVLKNADRLIVEIVDTVAMETGSQQLNADNAWSATTEPSPGYENTPAGHAAFLSQIGAEVGTIRISEVMSDPAALLADAYGQFPDWVELYNTGAETVNLEGWYLSDDPADPCKWSFPSVEIGPGQHLVIFCSGKDTQIQGQVHTSFSLSSTGESLILSSYLGLTMDAVTFGEAKTNHSFTFDGGAILTDAPTPGYPNDSDGYEQFCAAMVPAGPLAIWEVMTYNNTYLPQKLGKCYDWVELRNISDSKIHLSDYCITEDPDVPGMYTLPDQDLAPGASIIIILSGDTALSSGKYAHAPFSLNASGDQLLVYTRDAKLVDHVYLPDIPIGMSYGRGEQAGGFYFMEPSPKNPNRAGYRQISSEPVSDYTPGVYSSNSTVVVTLDADGVIYYTTDGSEPGKNSKKYTGPISVDETQVLRAVSVEDGKLPSDIYTATFVIGQEHDLPVVSLVTDPSYLFGPRGVYRNGDADVREVRMPSNVAYSGEDGTFSLDCEMSLHGEITIIKFDKKSFTIRFKEGYDGPLYYDVFGDGEVTAFSSLLIRTSHETTYSSQMHDTFIADFAVDHCDTVIAQKYKYAALYLNGEYWGLYAIREHHSEDHYASYMEFPSDSVKMVRFCNDTSTSLYQLYSFCEHNSLSSAKNYEYAKSIIDVTSFADWIILEAYMCNIDINNNMRYYYSTVDGLWRCGLADLDLGICGSHAAFDEIMTAWHHGKLVRALMENEEFQALLATRLAELLAGPMSDANMIARIDAMAAEIRSEAANEEARWKTPVPHWERCVEIMKEFCDGRAKKMIDSLCRELNFTQSEKMAYFGDLLQ